MGAWMIRAGRNGIYAEDWVERGIIGIGWSFGGADISSMAAAEIKDAYAALHADESRGKVNAAASQVCHFAHDMNKGTAVVMYDPASRLYHLGSVTGDCVSSPDEDGVEYFRTVTWQMTAARDALATASKNSLGGIQTIFRVSKQVLDDLNRASAGTASGSDACSDDGADPTEEADNIADDGIERIKDRVLHLEWPEMEALVEGMLKAAGYYAHRTEKGSDRGRDVIASPDPLGLESPHIVAEVKHRAGAIRAPEMRAFIGGLRAGDRGLYVSTGGFTREAKYEAERSDVPVRLLDLDRFVELYVQVYDNADIETRTILPLKRVWWPA